MLWQRKIELEREMNDVLDPTVGGDVVGAMKREIHRMQLRAGELGRLQEGLLLDLERSIAKRDTITLKVGFRAYLCCLLLITWSIAKFYTHASKVCWFSGLLGGRRMFCCLIWKGALPPATA